MRNFVLSLGLAVCLTACSEKPKPASPPAQPDPVEWGENIGTYLDTESAKEALDAAESTRKGPIHARIDHDEFTTVIVRPRESKVIREVTITQRRTDY